MRAPLRALRHNPGWVSALHALSDVGEVQRATSIQESIVVLRHITTAELASYLTACTRAR